MDGLIEFKIVKIEYNTICKREETVKLKKGNTGFFWESEVGGFVMRAKQSLLVKLRFL
jgi:hypothetical protein